MVPSHLRALSVSEYHYLIQAGYQVDELWSYCAEGQDSPQYISIHRVERLAEIHIGCQQPTVKVTQTLSEDTECQVSGKLLGRETRLLVALLSEQLLAGPVENSCRNLAWHREVNPHVVVTLLNVTLPIQD